MSKSLGNSPDPLDVIDQYGADALRFTIVSLAPIGQDVRFDAEKTEIGRNFANKIWNAARFVLMNLGDAAGRAVGPDARRRRGTRPRPARPLDPLAAADRHRRDARRASRPTASTTRRRTLYHFIWGEFCDWYLELVQADALRRRRGGEGSGAAHAGAPCSTRRCACSIRSCRSSPRRSGRRCRCSGRRRRS